MFDKNNMRPMFMVGFAILILIAVSFIPENAKLGSYAIKKVDLFSDIKSDSAVSMNLLSGKSQYAGVINFDLLKNILENEGRDKAENPAELNYSPLPQAGLSGNLSQLSHFFQALKQSHSRKVRIAHFGDSDIEGDLITADLRQNLQSEFGGIGAGFLAITSQDIQYRVTTKQTFSDNWKTASVVVGNPEKLTYGFNGSVFVPKGSSWVRYEGSGRYRTAKSFKYAKVFYSDAKSSSIKYSFNNAAEQSASIQSGSGIKELTLKANGEVNSVKITTTMANQAHFYGVSLESDNGVYVDNLPLRGNSGVGLKEISTSVMSDFNKYLDYKLIILEFGLNVVSSGMKDYSGYESEMIKIVNNIKRSYPQSSILIVGVGDKGFKKGNKFVTDPGVLKLIEVQKSIASKTGVAFWNLFEAMGGMNCMESWVKANLAFTDYSHVNLDGAKKIAGLLSKALTDEYRKSK